LADPRRRSAFVVEALALDPDLLSVEVLRRAKLKGYTGGKTALYDLISAVRPKTVRPLVRFEGLAGEFSQHDFGHVDVRFIGGGQQRIHFFASRLKYSRWVEVTIVPDEQTETLVRTLVDHFAAIGGIPLLAVFDRPKTVALKWNADGQVTEWNALFAGVALDLGLGIEVCWPSSPPATRATARPWSRPGPRCGRAGHRFGSSPALIARTSPRPIGVESPPR